MSDKTLAFDSNKHRIEVKNMLEAIEAPRAIIEIKDTNPEGNYKNKRVSIPED